MGDQNKSHTGSIYLCVQQFHIQDEFQNLNLLGLFKLVWVKDNIPVRNLSNLKQKVFEGKKLRFLGLANFRLCCTKQVILQKGKIFDEGCVLMKCNLIRCLTGGICFVVVFFFSFLSMWSLEGPYTTCLM